jgi:hypothetical protein
VLLQNLPIMKKKDKQLYKHLPDVNHLQDSIDEDQLWITQLGLFYFILTLNENISNKRKVGTLTKKFSLLIITFIIFSKH